MATNSWVWYGNEQLGLGCGNKHLGLESGNKQLGLGVVKNNLA